MTGRKTAQPNNNHKTRDVRIDDDLIVVEPIIPVIEISDDEDDHRPAQHRPRTTHTRPHQAHHVHGSNSLDAKIHAALQLMVENEDVVQSIISKALQFQSTF